MTQRRIQCGSRDTFRQLIGKTDPTLIRIYNSLLCPRQKVVRMLLFTLKQALQAIFSLQGHSPASEYIVDGSGDGIGRGSYGFVPWSGLVWMAQLHMPVQRTLPCLSSLGSIKATGDEGWSACSGPPW